MSEIFTNSGERGDFIENFLRRHHRCTQIRIASAFFTNSELLLDLAENGADVRLVIRLGFPTHPAALLKVYNQRNIHIRFFTSISFHPKFYLFDDIVALVGSANLTQPGVRSNQEVAVAINGEDPAFEDLEVLFGKYWDAATPLTKEAINALGKWALTFGSGDHEREVQKRIESEIGQSVYKNITRDVEKKSQEIKFYESYLRHYGELLKNIDEVIETYKGMGRRLSSDDFPLRLEVDSLLSCIRHKHAGGDTYLTAPVRSKQDRRDLIIRYAEEFLEKGYPYFTNDIITMKYPKLMNVFRTKEALEAADQEEIYESLLTVHAVLEQQRFHLGGEPTFRRAFLADNTVERVKTTFNYLLFEPDTRTDWRRRIAKCIHDDELRLAHFSKSCVQELYGWINQNEVPICNERTVKVIKWLGFPSIAAISD